MATGRGHRVRSSNHGAHACGERVISPVSSRFSSAAANFCSHAFKSSGSSSFTTGPCAVSDGNHCRLQVSSQGWLASQAAHFTSPKTHPRSAPGTFTHNVTFRCSWPSACSR